MKKAVIITTGLLVLTFFAVRSAITAAKNLSYKLQKISINSSNTTIFQTALDLTIAVTNNYTQTVYFDRFAGTINKNSKQLFAFDIDSQNLLVIPPGESKSITFPVIINNFTTAAELINILKEILSNSAAAGKINIKGTLYADSLSLTINEDVDLKDIGIGRGRRSAIQPESIMN